MFHISLRFMFQIFFFPVSILPAVHILFHGIYYVYIIHVCTYVYTYVCMHNNHKRKKVLSMHTEMPEIKSE